MTFAPTDEQLVALRMFTEGGSLAIEAGAGTGKTSTLELLARSTSRRGQYVAFNKAIVVDSNGRFPDTVACSTAHALAFRAVGKNYQHRLNGRRMKSLEIARLLGIQPVVVTTDGTRKVMQATFLAGLVMQTIVKFCQTADEAPSLDHVPYIDGIDDPTSSGKRTYVNQRIVRKHIDGYVTRAWDDLQRLDGALPFRHDHYLKLWQLSRPRVNADYILFDEAQDANPVLVAVISDQVRFGTQIVWVGDTNQAIYAFTGAVNALASVPAEHRAFLQQSFRFGPAVADVANSILGNLDTPLRLIGSPYVESTVERIEDPNVILCRTNAVAVNAVLSAQALGKRVHLVGGGRDIVEFAKASDLLKQNRNVEHPELACFDSWSDVQDYVNHDEQGGDLRLLVKLVDDFTVPVILAALDRMIDEADADLIVSTAHKSKGRQWSRVQLAGDFSAEPSDEELRLLYVAITRAQHMLDISAVKFLDGHQEDPPALPTVEATVTPPAEPPVVTDALATQDMVDMVAHDIVNALRNLSLLDGPSRQAALDLIAEVADDSEVTEGLHWLLLSHNPIRKTRPVEATV